MLEVCEFEFQATAHSLSPSLSFSLPLTERKKEREK